MEASVKIENANPSYCACVRATGEKCDPRAGVIFRKCARELGLEAR